MDPKVLFTILSLIDRAASTATALRGIHAAMERKVALGQEITMDDLKQYSLADDKARDALESAIQEAEAGG